MIGKTISKILLLSILMFTFGLSLSAKDKVIDSMWVTSQMQIDGSDADWADGAFTFEKKKKVNYAFRNDGDYFFILFKFTDPEYLSSLNQTGLTVWINTEGKKKRNYGINFGKKQVTADQYIAIWEKQSGALTEEKKNEIRQNPAYVITDATVINEKSKSTPEEAETMEYKAAVYKTSRQQDGLVYEFVIPLERVHDFAPGISAAPGDTVKINFQWGGMTDAMKAQRMKRLGDASSRARPQKATDNATQERRVSSGSADMSSIRRRSPKKHDFWVDVRLAVKQ
jgi:hypothetical protein